MDAGGQLELLRRWSAVERELSRRGQEDRHKEMVEKRVRSLRSATPPAFIGHLDGDGEGRWMEAIKVKEIVFRDGRRHTFLEPLDVVAAGIEIGDVREHLPAVMTAPERRLGWPAKRCEIGGFAPIVPRHQFHPCRVAADGTLPFLRHALETTSFETAEIATTASVVGRDACHEDLSKFPPGRGMDRIAPRDLVAVACGPEEEIAVHVREVASQLRRVSLGGQFGHVGVGIVVGHIKSSLVMCCANEPPALHMIGAALSPEGREHGPAIVTKLVGMVLHAADDVLHFGQSFAVERDEQ